MEKLDKIYKSILGDGLREFKYLNSHLKPSGTDKGKMKGSIFCFREKEALKVGRGVILTSTEAVSENTDAFTHWTPNVYRYGRKKGNGIVEGYSENNLRQINTFIVDIDSKDFNWTDILLLGLDKGLMPTMILETNKGYQVYYVLSKPAFVTNKSNYKVINVAKKISATLRRVYSEEFLAVDMGCNHFGIARMPRTDNVLYFDANNCRSFGDWINWSIKQADSLDNRPVHMQLISKRNSESRQIDEPWFDLLLRRGQIHGEKGVLGRNNTLLTLALAFLSSGKGKQNCEYNLYQFNSRLDQPLKDTEVQRIIDSTYSGKYKAAQRAYITRLVQNWVDSSLSEQDLFKNNSKGWYKFAKPREERKNSHFSETEDDLLAYLRKKCTVDKPYLTCTAKELTAELGMSLASFKVVKKRLGAKNKIKFSSTKGRNGRTTLVLIELLVIGVISQKKAFKNAYISGLAELISTTTEHLKRVVATFTQNNQSLNTQVDQLEFLEVNTS